jgi:hypothetical protein
VESKVDGNVITVTIENRGYLPTNILTHANELSFAEPVRVLAEPEEIELSDPRMCRVDLGQLDGWGRGRHTGAASLHAPRSRGNEHRRVLHYHVTGVGLLNLRVGNNRTGFAHHRVPFG